jgi:hypothetical protein
MNGTVVLNDTTRLYLTAESLLRDQRFANLALAANFSRSRQLSVESPREVQLLLH